MTALLVKLDDDLPAYRLSGLVHNMAGLPGVQSVTDMAFISRETLEVVLLAPAPPEPEAAVDVVQEPLL